MHKLVLCIFLLVLRLQSAWAQVPGTEIFLFDLKIKGNTITLSNPRNITKHTGYDNQPFFHPDKQVLYYVSADEDGRTDIIEFNYATNSTKKITDTPEREYSPTVTPDKKFLSCIIQRDSGEQDLAKYPIEGGEPEIIINNLKVGYHAWVDHSNVVVFVLGEPNTLRWYSVPDKKDLVLAENIGRSLHRISGKNSVSFIHKISADQWLIERIDKPTSSPVAVAEALKGREFLTWTSRGRILMSDDKKIFWTDPSKGSTWNEVKILSSQPLNAITRLAVNGKDNVIAVVVSE